MGGIIYKELSYDVMACAFKVFKELGFGYREKYYQRALAEELKIAKIKFATELPIKLYYGGKIIGKYIVDFFIEDKIILEIKIAKDFYTKDIKQLLSYLKAHNLRLGILIIVTKDGMKFKRIAN